MTFEEWAKSSKWDFDSSEYAKEIKEIAKAAWEAARPKWLPIESAPEFKDVLVKEITGHVYIAERQRDKWWQSVESADIRVRPVKWMPIPE